MRLAAVGAALAALLVLTSCSRNEPDPVPKPSATTTSPSATPAPAPIADINPIEDSFRQGIQGESWADQVRSIYFLGADLIVPTTFEAFQTVPAHDACEAAYAAAKAHGAEIEQVVVKSRDDDILSSRDEQGGALLCS